MEQTFMKEKPILSLVLSMSLPMILSMMVTSLYNIIDSFFVAKISEDAMTALSLVFPIQNFINAVTIGFSIGINAVISYYLGAQNKRAADHAAALGLILNTFHGILLSILCIWIMPFFLKMFTKDTTVIDLGLGYSRIAFSFAVIISLGMTFEKIFQSVGKMSLTMFCMMGGCITNILLDPVLIFGWGPVPKLGIEGAAWATGIGQAVSLLLYLIFYIRKPLPVTITFRHLAFQKDLIFHLYAIGVPATLNLALPSLLISALNVILSAYSQTYVVVLGIYYKLQTFLYLPANGIVQGMRPLVGYNYGAGESVRVSKIYRVALLLGAGIMALGTLLCQTIPALLIGMFTSSSETIEAGTLALRIISIGFLASTVSVISSGALEGLGMGVPSLMISLLRYVLITIPAAFLFSFLFGAIGVWHGFWLSELLTGLISYFLYQKMVSKRT